MTEIKLFDIVGEFAENKDFARDIRIQKIIPELDNGGEVILDFASVSGATQSFIHALISDLLRNYGSEVLDKISFKNCNEIVQKIIGIVVEYMQESD
ncbi:MAG: STAS-like domain-containing protein [Candidatus Omnitrophica bacterium]|nr:STAS-like domain-containing protein [Candidatus Omnitrophota bacterium]